MTIQMTKTSSHPRRPLRSTAAVFLGFFAVVVLSLGTDQVLHVLKVYPSWGQPMHDPGLILPALAYRIVYAVVGSHIAARLAPRNPMRHALALGVIRVRSEPGRRDRHDPDGPGPGLVPECARGHRLALRLAWRRSAPHKAGAFQQSVKLKPDETVVFAWIVYKSRTHRDQVNAQVMNDPRLAKRRIPGPAFRRQRMIWGDFAAMVEL